ncbi:MAG: carboxypeptidase-like regulatory domain-containing protein, partial [Myxococcota bacterium]|nr:carboxypeptidase-like regulatory domain-containing protein [Myxococcota bacterium]
DDGSFSLSLGAGAHQLRFSMAGYLPTRLETSVTVESGREVALADEVTLRFEPASIRGQIQRLNAQGEASPASGLNVVLQRTPSPGFLPQTVEVQSDEEGAFSIPQLIEGLWSISAVRPGYRALQSSARVIPGEALELPPLVITPLQRRVVGSASRLEQGGQGGVLITIRGEATIGGAIQEVALSEGGSDEFRFPAVPAGTYQMIYSAEGYAPQLRALEVTEDDEGADAPLELDPVILSPRRFRCQPPTVSSSEEFEVILEADDALSHARVWSGSFDPPEGLPWLPRGEESVSLSLPEGVHIVFCQFATSEHVRGEESVYSFASQPLERRSVIDLSAPEVTFATVPTQGEQVPAQDRLYLPIEDPFFIDVAAFDPVPGPGLETLRLYLNDDPPVDLAFSSRVLGPTLNAGVNQLSVSVVDTAGNESVLYQLPTLIGDERAPVNFQPEGPPLQSEVSQSASRLVDLSFALNDPEPSEVPAPLYFRLFELGTAPGPWLPYEESALTFTLAEGEDGARTIIGEAKDAAGRHLEGNSLQVTLDRSVINPTELSLFEGARSLPANTTVRLNGAPLRLRVEAAGAAESVTARLLLPHVGSCRIRRGASSCLISGLPSRTGQLTYLVELVDDVGNRSDPVALSLNVDNFPPRSPRLTPLTPLGVKATRERTIRVELSAIDAVAYALTGDLDPTPQTPASFPLEREITLTPGDGSKEVTVTFFDTVGNEVSLSKTFSLDQTPPVIHLSLSQSGEPVDFPLRTRSPQVEVTLESPE